MIKILWLALFFSSLSHALVPVEGILLGEAEEGIQSDPLKTIFHDFYDKSLPGENIKMALYLAKYRDGEALKDSCSYLGAPVYASSLDEKQVKRAVASTLQYIGLDATIKAIGAYAKKMEMSETNFSTLASNLVRNYCSKNVTVISLNTIQKSLNYYFKNPDTKIIPSLVSSPFAPSVLKEMTEKKTSRSREFDRVIRNFRSFCSWGGLPEDYRMLTSYLKNPIIMAFVIKNLQGLRDEVNSFQKVVTLPAPNTVQVGCDQLICRKETNEIFRSHIPLTIGSTGLGTDLNKLYCHHFRYQDSSKSAVKEVKEWIKKEELEDPILETSQFIALMTNFPDLINSADTYRDVPMMAKSSIDERWNLWAKKMLKTFSHDLLYEESLKVKILPRTPTSEASLKGFGFDFQITMGELDRVLEENDKLRLSFDLKISKNYLRMIRSRWSYLSNKVDFEGQREFKTEVSRYLEIQLKEKEKLFKQKIWNDDFSRILADELIRQSLAYKGKMFNSYEDQVLTVPVHFSYGLFALSYLRYRGDVNAGRLKLNL